MGAMKDYQLQKHWEEMGESSLAWARVNAVLRWLMREFRRRQPISGPTILITALLLNHQKSTALRSRKQQRGTLMTPGPETPRRRAVVWYRTGNGLIDCDHFFEELSELHGLIERGPSFYALEKIEVFYQLASDDTLTLEEPERL
jgi:hypothetical protein